MNIYVFLIIVVTVLVSIIKYKYTTIRYNLMVYFTVLKKFIKKNDVYIIQRLDKCNLYINKIILFFDSNPIMQELIQSNKISLRFIILSKNILNMLNKLILFIINKMK